MKGTNSDERGYCLEHNVAKLCKRNSLFMGLLVVENQSGRMRANQVAREKCAQCARHELLRVHVRGYGRARKGADVLP